MYDCQNKLAPIYFHDYFVQCSQVHHYSTRLASRGDLFLERKNTFQYGIRSIVSKALEYASSRCQGVLLTISISIRFLKKYFLSQYASSEGAFRIGFGCRGDSGWLYCWDAGVCWDWCLPFRILTDIDFCRVLVWWTLIVVDAGVFRCGWCGHSWVGSVTAEPAWNVLIFFL